MEWRLIQWVFCMFYRQDRHQVLPVTRQSTGKLPPARQYDVINNSTAGRTGVLTGKTSEEIKEKLEQQLRQQRAALVQKRALESRGKRILPFFYFIDSINVSGSVFLHSKPFQVQRKWILDKVYKLYDFNLQDNFLQ